MLKPVMALWAAVFSFACLVPATAQADSAFRAGAAKVDSTPTQELCTGGYGIFCGWKASQPRPNAIGGTDRLYTRALVIESEGQRIALVTTSAIGIFAAYKPMLDQATGRVVTPPGLYDTRLRIARELGIASDHVFIQSDHSHRSPDTIGIWGGVPPAYLEKLQDDMVKVVHQASARMADAELFVGSIDGSAVNCPATYPIAPGNSAPLPRCQVDSLYSFAPNEWVDNEFRVLEARHAVSGARIASFANYSTHATVLADAGTGVFSGDWTGWLAAMLDDDATGAIGLATVGTLGRTDFESGGSGGDGDAFNLNRERAARARLNYFMDSLRAASSPSTGIKPYTRIGGSGVQAQEIFLHEMNVNPIFLANYAPFVGVPNPDGSYPSETQASIDRSVIPPFLTGTMLGTFAGAFRIGDVFFATAPGEEFPNAQKCLRDGCDQLEGMPGKVVIGTSGITPRMHFFLGATNDFLGYMGPAATYDQVAAQGATYFFCPPGDMERQGRDTLNPITSPAGYEAGRLFDEGSCPDHFVLMSSPVIGDHVNCTIQNAAKALGFGVEDGTPACAALTAADELGAPPATAAGTDSPDSGQAGLVGLLTQLAADLMEALGSAFSANLNTLLGTVQQAWIGLKDNLYGLLVGDDDASVAAAVRNAATNPQGDGAGTASDLLRDLQRIVLGYAAQSNVRAGVGIADMTPDVGYCAGQYCDSTNLFDGVSGGDIDPFATHKTKRSSYGVQSRLTARAIVVEGNNGKRVVLLKTDNYLAQDALMRRVGQLLAAAGSSIGYEQILHSATHNHSSSYSSTPSWGVWVFEDVFDPRFFEHQALKITQAILAAEQNLKPARMGATTVRHKTYKGNVVRLADADDGTPAGYPLEYGDLGLVVMRFDELTAQGPKPLAAWVNWGEHPESLDGYDLHTADFLGPFERFVEQGIGAPLVFSQGDVGSAEAEGNKRHMTADDGSVCGDWAEDSATPARNDCAAGEGVLRVFEHAGYAQYERNVRFLADGVIKGWKVIGGELAPDAPAAGIAPNNYVPEVQVAMSNDFPVDLRNYWAPGPLSHPYPGVSNCKTDKTAGGDVGVPVAGLPDCGRFGFPGQNEVTGQAAVIYATMKAEGVPVPDHYDGSAFTGVEENLRIYLQTFRLGEVLLASCACEAQVDLILNLETRSDQVSGNQYNGFDWACLVDNYKDDPAYAAACAAQTDHYNPAEFPTGISGTAAGLADSAAIARMRAQVHNDARGWDLPENAVQANSEPPDTQLIWGNFTHEELPSQRGYKLPVGLGHSGDYVGYTVSYREFMNRDSYRKALTAYGPHTADYMVSRLVRMAGAMKGGPELLPEPHDGLAQADEGRQVAQSTALGATTAAAYAAWLSALPLDVGPAQSVTEPADIAHFDAAEFRWRGGNTQIDNPLVRVEILCDAAGNYAAFRQADLATRCAQAGVGEWVSFAGMSGEVQSRVHWPAGLPGVISTYAGQFAWEWTANFEAYQAFPARLGSTPYGQYRFVVQGCINDGTEDGANHLQRRLLGVLPLAGDACLSGARNYELTSAPFRVSSQAAALPRSYASSFPFIQDKPDTADRDQRVCETCSFRPWATALFGGVQQINTDADGDGVSDALDQCSGTLAGAEVDSQGCSVSQRDADGDGVADAADQCSGTPAEATVNAQGCALSQLDSDGDDVSDATDQCANTAAGTTVNAQGCPVGIPGDFTVRLSATPNGGDVSDRPLQVSFNANAENTYENAGTLRYVFYYGDGTDSGLQTAATAIHSYDKASTYQARVVVIDAAERTVEDGVSIVTTTGVVVDPDPVVVMARLTVRLFGNRAPVVVTLDASGSSAPQGALYRFSFGDGQSSASSTSPQASHTYPVAGDYTVTVTVTDAANASNNSSASAQITIGSGQETTVQLVVTPTTARIGENVSFDARASLPADGATLSSFRFDFGDGSPVVTRTVAEFGDQAGLAIHAYSRAGSYTPIVTVTDSGQAARSKSLNVTVTPTPTSTTTPTPTPTPPQPAPQFRSSKGGAMGWMTLLPMILMLRRRRIISG